MTVEWVLLLSYSNACIKCHASQFVVFFFGYASNFENETTSSDSVILLFPMHWCVTNLFEWHVAHFLKLSFHANVIIEKGRLRNSCHKH